MISILLLLILLFGFLRGLKRGFILQLFHLIGFIAAFIVAALYYDELGAKAVIVDSLSRFGRKWEVG